MKKGIALVSLVVVIIIISIISGVIIVESNKSMELTNMTMFSTEILNVQTSVDEYKYKYGTYPIAEAVIYDTTGMPYEELEQFTNETINNNNITLYTINMASIGIDSTEFGNNNASSDMYAVSNITGTVYYLKGLKYNGKKYYTWAKEISMGAVNDRGHLSENEIKKYDVIFSASSIKYTNQPIIVNVKIPKDATFNSITATGGKSVGQERVEGQYRIVTINETTLDKNGNYIITVNYTQNGNVKGTTYEVTNFDNTPPQLTVTESADVQDSNKIVVTLVSSIDNESEIKYIKYENSNIQDHTYFNIYGKSLKESFKVSTTSDYTIYAVDNAGNYCLLHKQ